MTSRRQASLITRHSSLVTSLLLTAFPALLLPAELVHLTPPPAPLVARPGKLMEVPVRFTVEHGYHINSNRPSLDYLIPTRLEWSASGLKHLEDRFPPAELKAFSFSPEKKLSVYEGRQTMKSRFAVPATAPAGKLTLSGRLHYQACDDKTCYPPASVDVRVPVEIQASRR